LFIIEIRGSRVEPEKERKEKKKKPELGKKKSKKKKKNENSKKKKTRIQKGPIPQRHQMSKSQQEKKEHTVHIRAND
jgi:hypothetical protein